MEILAPSYFMAALHCAREYLLTRPWGVVMNHLSLAYIFEEIEKHKTGKMNDLYRAHVGSQIKLLDKQTLTFSTVTLTEPDDSNPSSGKISYLSLLGSKLLGAVSGQHISIDVLGRAIKFRVLSVKNVQPT